MKNQLQINFKQLAMFIAVIISSLFAAFLSPAFGIPMAAAFVLALIMTFVFINISASRVRVSVSLSTDCVHKGEPVKINVTVHNDSFLPISAFKIPMQVGEGLKCVLENFETDTVQGKSEATLVSEYTANIWGKHEITADDSTVSDLFGIFSMVVAFTDFKGTVRVYPELFVPEVNELAVSLQSVINESDEDGTEGIRSEPGYEHRAYEPGDPIKRVNWKYSAKKDTLLVRTLDFSGLDEFTILLAPHKNAGAGRVLEARLVEGFLAMMVSMRKLVLKCKACCYINNTWYSFAINTMDDIYALQEALCHFEFITNAPDLPEIDYEASTTVFTCRPDTAPPHAETVTVYSGGAWLVSENYDIFKS